MLWRLALTLLSLIAMGAPAAAHTIGLAEQVLQPVTTLHSLLPLIAVGLLCRQQAKPVPLPPLALMLGLGLTAGWTTLVHLTGPNGQLIFPLALAAVAGGLVALARPLPERATLLIVLALGAAVGAGLSSQTTDWMDLAQTLMGAFAGAIAALLVLTTLPVAPANDWRQIGERVIGSWILACAMMVLALNARTLM